jgi:hypothetical protein
MAFREVNQVGACRGKGLIGSARKARPCLSLLREGFLRGQLLKQVKHGGEFTGGFFQGGLGDLEARQARNV